MGLKSDIMQAKKEALIAQDIEVRDEDFEYDSPNEIEARYMTDAIINFLTHPELHFTVSKLRASVEIEELHTFQTMDADVKNEITVKNKISELSAAKTGTDLIVGKLEQLKDIEVAGVKPLSSILGPFITMYKTFWKTTEKAVAKSIPKSEGEGWITVHPQSYLIEGGDNGRIDARGHAHIGEDNPVLDTDTGSPDSDDNLVVLYEKNLPEDVYDQEGTSVDRR
tara:strand:+ start:35 stop:706 length:672 start_codon:yes stop_codon:yes gene_type:complete